MSASNRHARASSAWSHRQRGVVSQLGAPRLAAGASHLLPPGPLLHAARNAAISLSWGLGPSLAMVVCLCLAVLELSLSLPPPPPQENVCDWLTYWHQERGIDARWDSSDLTWSVGSPCLSQLAGRCYCARSRHGME